MSEIQYTQTQRLGRLPVDKEMLERYVFCLPEGYHIVGVVYSANGIIDFTIESEDLPEATGRDLPRLRLIHTQEILPDQDPAYRKITARVEIS